jgi:hypothetical protein
MRFFLAHRFVSILSLTLWIASTGLAGPAGDWQMLISEEGEGMAGWRGDTGAWENVGAAQAAPQGAKKILTEQGSGILVNGPDGKTVDLFTEMEHGDLEASIEFMVPPESNSGIYFMGRYEVQVLDSWGEQNPTYADCGGIYQRWKEDKGYEGHAPRVNASRAPGEWQTFYVVFRAPRFDESGKKTTNARFEKVVHNGRVVQENVEVTGPTRAAAFEDERASGPLMLQGDHGPVAYRLIEVRTPACEE